MLMLHAGLGGHTLRSINKIWNKKQEAYNVGRGGRLNIPFPPFPSFYHTSRPKNPIYSNSSLSSHPEIKTAGRSSVPSLKPTSWGHLSRSVKCLTVDVGSDHDLMVCGIEPQRGSAHPLPTLPCSLTHTLSQNK